MTPSPHSLSLQSAERIDAQCDDFEAAWTSGQSPSIEQYLAATPPDERESTFVALLRVELELRRRAGAAVDAESYVARFPELAAQVRSVFSERQAVVDTSVSFTSQTAAATPDSKPAEEAEEPLPTKIGKFEVVEKIGAGAFGVVVRARDPQLDREVAIKFPRRGTLDKEFLRFTREAVAAANMHHPNICPVYEVGTADGRPYIVMSLVPGKSLAEHLRQAKEPMPIRQAVLTVRKLAQALALAHDKGIVHRDLKPANVMLDRERKDVVIMDFGLARVERHDDIGLTVSGMVLGTPAYMSPEQARGDQKAIGPPTDIYSLGVILHELLTRQRPFEGSMAEVLGKILHVPAPGPAAMRPEVGSQLDGIVRKCMAKEPAQRFRSMRELADALTKHLKARGADREMPAAETRDDMFATVASPEREHGEFKTPVADAQGSLKRGSPPRRRIGVLLGFGFVAALILFGIMFFARTPTAEVFFHLKAVDPTDATLSFTLDGKPVAAADLIKPTELKVGAHELLVKRGEDLLHKYTFKVSLDAGPRIELGEEPVKPPSTIVEQPSANRDRFAAEWVLRQKGAVAIVAEGTDHEQRIGQVESLPASFQLVGLDLWGLRLDDGSLRMLRDLKHLRFAIFFGCQTVNDDGLKTLGGIPSLRLLILGDNPITDRGLAELHNLTALEVLNIGGQGITAEGMTFIAKLPSLVTLTLRAAQVDSLGLSRLKEVATLESLTLEGEPFSDSCVDGLADLRSLRKLILVETKISAEGLSKLQSALPNCQVTPADANPDRALAEWAVGNGASVKVVVGEIPRTFEELTNVPIITDLAQLPTEPFQVIGVQLHPHQGTDENIARLNGLKNLRFALLRGDGVTDKGVQLLTQHRRLRVLQLESKNITAAATGHLGQLTELQELLLDTTRVNDESLRHLTPLTRLQVLSLDGAMVRGLGAVHLAGSPLRRLFVRGPSLTDEGLQAISRLPRLTHLHFDAAEKVSDDGLAHLKELTMLEDLVCGAPQVTDKGLAHLEGCNNLRELHLFAPKITDDGLAQVGQIKSLRLLHFSTPLATAKGIERLTGLKLRDLVIQGTRVGDDALLHIAKMEQLQRLELHNTSITGGEFGHLENLPRLLALRIMDSPINDTGLAAFKPPPELQTLYLIRSKVTDEGLVHLHGVKSLRAIELDGSPITAVGLAALRKALPECSIKPEASDPAAAVVARLESMGARLTRDEKAPGNAVVIVSFYGAKQTADDALLAELRHLPALQTLVLWGCDQVTDGGLIALGKLPNLRSLDLGVTRISDKGVENLKPLGGLENLNLSYTQVTDAGLAHLAGMKQLQALGLDSLTVTDEGLQHLEGLTELTHLNLLSTKVQGPGLRHLAGMRELGQLWLANSRVDDESLKHLESLKALRQLLLDKTPVTQAGVDRLKKALPECEIGFGDPARAAAEFLVTNKAIIAGQTSDGAPIGDPKSVEELPAKPFEIHYIEASQCNALTDEALTKHAGGLKHLQRINGNFTKFTGTGFAAFQESKLEVLDLTEGSFTDEGLKAVCGIPTLKELHLPRHREITDAGLVDLHRLPELRILNLAATKITNDGLREIARCPDLRILAIGHTAIDNEGLARLADLRLSSLGIGNTKVTDAGLIHLKGMNLDDLHLSGDTFGDDGLRYLSGMTNLRRAHFSGTKITAAGVAHLKGLKLDLLQLRDAPVDDAAIEHLLEIKSLKSLDLRGTNVGPEGLQRIKEGLPECKVTP
jgi:serine/threonine protein kinase/Leucine-rich repeat (LRR) protein